MFCVSVLVGVLLWKLPNYSVLLLILLGSALSFELKALGVKVSYSPSISSLIWDFGCSYLGSNINCFYFRGWNLGYCFIFTLKTGCIGFDLEVILISFVSMELGEATYLSGFSIDLFSSLDSSRDGTVVFSFMSNSERSYSGSVIWMDSLKLFDFSFNSALSSSFGVFVLLLPIRIPPCLVVIVDSS